MRQSQDKYKECHTVLWKLWGTVSPHLSFPLFCFEGPLFGRTSLWNLNLSLGTFAMFDNLLSTRNHTAGQYGCPAKIGSITVITASVPWPVNLRSIRYFVWKKITVGSNFNYFHFQTHLDMTTSGTLMVPDIVVAINMVSGNIQWHLSCPAMKHWTPFPQLLFRVLTCVHHYCGVLTW